jgi:hypothetical protein
MFYLTIGNMAHPLIHAKSSVKKHGGIVENYLPIHQWFDETKAHMADFRHRALRHHSLGIFWAEEKFGVFITNSDGKQIPVRVIGEQHVMEDCGFIPTPQDWLKGIPSETWQRKTMQIQKELS